MKSDMNCVVLFDIDGTLVTRSDQRPSAGQRAMNDAAFEMTGKEGLVDRIEFAGATDLGVARSLLEMGEGGPPSMEMMRDLLERYVLRMRALIKEDSYLALGNPREVIPELGRRGAVIGLATGNVVEGARAKLESAGLDDLFDMGLGGYGDDAEERWILVRKGIERCDPGGGRIAVVVGDTPLDIEAAHLAGAKCVAVPWGENDLDSLERAGADGVVSGVTGELIEAIERILRV